MGGLLTGAIGRGWPASAKGGARAEPARRERTRRRPLASRLRQGARVATCVAACVAACTPGTALTECVMTDRTVGGTGARALVGIAVGIMVGIAVGVAVGIAVGIAVGVAMGIVVGMRPPCPPCTAPPSRQ